MKYVLILFAIFVIVYVAYESIRIFQLVRTSTELVRDARPYQRVDGEIDVLVLGDSTAVGVGSVSDETVAGRIAQSLNASIENYAVSGARTRDISKQLGRKQKDRYDLVLIQVGANDIIRFSEIDMLRDEISDLLQDTTSVSDRVVLLTAGKVGNAPIFPYLLGWIWNHRAGTVRTHFMAAAQKYDAVYVDLYAIQDPFGSEPSRYYAPDGLHLTGDGYGFWYERVWDAMLSRWPDIAYDARRSQ